MGRQFVEANIAVGLDDVGIVEMTYISVWIHGHKHWTYVRLPHTYTHTHTA